MAPRLKITSQLRVVEDLAVEHDPQGAVFVGDRLLAAVQIEDAETGVSQADVSVEVDPELVGAAVTDRPEHAAEGAPVGRRRPMQVAESDDAAHQRDPEAAVVWLSLPGRSATWSHPCLR